MRMAILAGAGLLWALGAGGHPNSEAARTAGSILPDSNPLAAKLTGTWAGTRHDSGSSAARRFTMIWKQDSTGELTGTVTPASGPA
jgi:hypothetical protein